MPEAAATPLEQPTQANKDTKAKPKRKPLPDHLPRVERTPYVRDADLQPIPCIDQDYYQTANPCTRQTTADSDVGTSIRMHRRPA